MPALFSRQRVIAGAGLVLVVLMFCLPLFVKLGDVDMANDEALYSYSVDRILETGHWLTPHVLPGDTAFLEKPPLMFWIVAAGMKTGFLPHNDFGMRFWAALFGGIAFVYVYLLGCRLHGPVAGIAAVLVLFTYEPLLFDHGLRSNNMEGALFLSYCAGMFHFFCWVQSESRAGRRAHAYAATLAVVLGFMTKFVAAIFLPIVWVVALLAHPDGIRFLRGRWREWIGPKLLAIVLIAPWFVYQTVQFKSYFWHIIFGQHVFTRFTTGLDPSHLRPWYFYFTWITHEFIVAGSIWAVGIGVAVLAIRAMFGNWPARFILAWATVPLVLISIGSSKLAYYADPFLPPLALGAGWLLSVVLMWVYANTFARPGQIAAPSRVPRAIRVICTAISFVAIGVALWTFCVGRFGMTVAHFKFFRNASIIRPLIIGVVFAWLGGRLKEATSAFGLGLFVLLMPSPLGVYAPIAREAQTTSKFHPLRTLRDCVAGQIQAGAIQHPMTYESSPMPTHAYFYYLRTLGPFVFREDGLADEVGRRLFDPDQAALVILTEDDYQTWLDRRRASVPPGQPLGIPGVAHAELDALIAMPGPYNACLNATLSAGPISSNDIARR